jgi:hypothetical protein
VKKYILAIAAIAALAPASSAYAGAEYKIDNTGPSVSLGGLLGGDGSSGGPIEIFGQEIEGLQSQGSARHRFEADTLPQDNVVTARAAQNADAAGFKEELRVKTSGLENVKDGDPVFYFSLSEILEGFVGGGIGALSTSSLGEPLPPGEIDGDTAELRYKYEGAGQTGVQPLQISHCGDIILGLPINREGVNLTNLLISSVSADGDVATAFGGSLQGAFTRQVFCPVGQQGIS